MNQLIPSFQVLVHCFAPCFRIEVFRTFEQMLCAWIVCLGRRTVSRVWESTGHAARRNHASAFRLFSASKWDWDVLCKILIKLVVTNLVSGKSLWTVVDDTLCYNRGAKVAFGGMFLDPVLSSHRYKVFRFAHNWVLLGIVVELPFRHQRSFCLPVLWRLYRKKGNKEGSCYKTKNQLAVEMLDNVLWHRTAAYTLFRIVIIHDPSGEWRDEALLSSNLTLLPEQIIVRYCQRWSVEVAFADMLATCRFHHCLNSLPSQSTSNLHCLPSGAWLLNYIATATFS
jgi:hypothetical protein